MFLTTTSDILRVVTAQSVSTITVQASWIDLNGSTYTPGRTNTGITTATTTTVVASPAGSTTRHVRNILVSNNHATSSCGVTLQHYDGTTSTDIMEVTLLAGERMLRDKKGEWRHLTAWGGEYTYVNDIPRQTLGITGTLGETVPRENCEEANLSLGGTGVLNLQAIWLRKGTVVTNISLCSATTAASVPTNWFFALYSQRFALLAQSANQTTTAWAANTLKTVAMTAAYTVSYSGFYYIGYMMTATTVPTIKGRAGVTANQVRASPFPLNGTSTSGLTTALPDPCASPGGTTAIFWAAVT